MHYGERPKSDLTDVLFDNEVPCRRYPSGDSQTSDLESGLMEDRQWFDRGSVTCVSGGPSCVSGGLYYVYGGPVMCVSGTDRRTHSPPLPINHQSQ